jgi:arabinofuranosyltransferase
VSTLTVWRRNPWTLLLALPVIILWIGGWKYHWMSDDGFINLRVTKQLLAGHGPVFNRGERVEATTSPLWTYLLVAAGALTPFRLEWIAVTLGIALTGFGLAAAIVGSSRLVRARRGDEVMIPLGALVVAVLAPMWKFSSGGLENGLTFAWLGVCLWVLAHWSHGESMSVPALVLLGLGPLIRPDISLFTIAFVALVLRFEWAAGWRRRVVVVSAALALPLAYQVFRMGYYASLAPSPAFAKEASRAYWSAGWTYLRKTIMPYGLWFPLGVIAIAAYPPLIVRLRRATRRRALGVVLTFGIVGIAHALYVIRVGGDFMNARLLLPSLFAFVIPAAVVPVRRMFLGTLLLVPWAIVALVALRSVDDQPRAFGKDTMNAVSLNDFGWGRNGQFRAQYSRPGVYYTSVLLPAPAKAGEPALVIAAYGVGEVGYAFPDAYVLDALGLGDAFTAHLHLTRRGIVAHEKPLPLPWIAARLTDPATQLQSSEFPQAGHLFPVDLASNFPFGERVSWARSVLECPTLRDFFDEYRGRVTVGRFVRNLGASFSNWGFRIPPEPHDAYEKYCRR